MQIKIFSRTSTQSITFACSVYTIKTNDRQKGTFHKKVKLEFRAFTLRYLGNE